jgi:hypothetical protein
VAEKLIFHSGPGLACGVEKYSTGCTVLYLDYTGSGGQGYSGVSRDASVSGGQHRRNHKWPIVTHLPAASPKPLRRVAAAITQRHAFVPKAALALRCAAKALAHNREALERALRCSITSHSPNMRISHVDYAATICALRRRCK